MLTYLIIYGSILFILCNSPEAVYNKVIRISVFTYMEHISDIKCYLWLIVIIIYILHLIHLPHFIYKYVEKLIIFGVLVRIYLTDIYLYSIDFNRPP